MTLAPMLGDFELPRLTRLETLERRGFVELPVPGGPRSLFQDAGRAPGRIVAQGAIFGEESGQDFLTSVREKFLAAEPLTFVSDVATGTEIQYVLIEQLHVQAAASHPDQIDYTIWMVESPPPPPPPDPLGGIDTSLLDQASGMLDSALGALDALSALGNVPDLSDPTKPLGGALDEVRSSAEQLGQLGSTLRGLFGG